MESNQQAAGLPSRILNEIKNLHQTIGSSIQAIIEPTNRIIIPHLLEAKKNIQAIPRTTQRYGSHPRQNLDIYQPLRDAADAPILIFLYGGGLVRGDKILQFVPEGLIFHNLGAFFATRGFTTIIPDYRRVNSQFGGEDAKYPSGGEDLSLVLTWLEESELLRNGKRDLFILGNSAGGIHLSTFLFEPRFLEQRRGLIDGSKGLLWKGAIELSVPFHFKSVAKPILKVTEDYYGSIDKIERRSPFGLLQTLVETKTSRQEAAVPKVLAFSTEYDPEIDIVIPVKDFAQLGGEHWGDGIELLRIEGHNHVSPALALMSGDEKAEKWGEDVVKWMLNQR